MIIAPLALSRRWPCIRARFLFREVNEKNCILPLASVTKEGGVEFRSDLDISVWNPGDDTSGYKRVQPGDFVIGLRSFQSGLGSSSIEGLVSPAYTVLRPTGSLTTTGYYKHLFKSEAFISRLENMAQGIRQGRTIAADDFGDLPLPVPPHGTQRLIADFLNAETARIDALIAKKRLLIDLLDTRFWAALVSLPVVARAKVAPLRRALLSIVDGPFGSAFTSADYTDSGVRVVSRRN